MSRIETFQDAKAFCRDFFHWYNNQHYHSGLNLLTPAMVHYGEAEEIIHRRQQVLDLAYARHPERFVNKAPEMIGPPNNVWINPPVDRAGA